MAVAASSLCALETGLGALGSVMPTDGMRYPWGCLERARGWIDALDLGDRLDAALADLDHPEADVAFKASAAAIATECAAPALAVSEDYPAARAKFLAWYRGTLASAGSGAWRVGATCLERMSVLLSDPGLSETQIERLSDVSIDMFESLHGNARSLAAEALGAHFGELGEHLLPQLLELNSFA